MSGDMNDDANDTPLSDRRRGGLPRGRRASDKGRHVWGLDIEEVYEAGRLGSAFGLLLLVPASAALVALIFVAAPLADVVRDRIALEVRRGLAFFLIGGWGGIAVSIARQKVERLGIRVFGARLAACTAAGAVAAAIIAESIRVLVGVFGETPMSLAVSLSVSFGGGAYLAAGITLVKALRHGVLGKRLAAAGLLAALLLAVASVAGAVFFGG